MGRNILSCLLLPLLGLALLPWSEGQGAAVPGPFDSFGPSDLGAPAASYGEASPNTTPDLENLDPWAPEPAPKPAASEFLEEYARSERRGDRGGEEDEEDDYAPPRHARRHYDDEDEDDQDYRPRRHSARRRESRRDEDDYADERDQDDAPQGYDAVERRGEQMRMKEVRSDAGRAANPDRPMPIRDHAPTPILEDTSNPPSTVAQPRFAEVRHESANTELVDADLLGGEQNRNEAARSSIDIGLDSKAQSMSKTLAEANAEASAAAAAEAKSSDGKDPLDDPLEEIKHDIISKSKQIKEELGWVDQVREVIEKYTSKMTNVENNVETLRGEVKDLLKKKRQVQNLKLQKQLQDKLEDANADMGTINTALGHVRTKETNFAKTKKNLSETIQGLQRALAALKGKTVEQMKAEADGTDFLETGASSSPASSSASAPLLSFAQQLNQAGSAPAEQVSGVAALAAMLEEEARVRPAQHSTGLADASNAAAAVRALGALTGSSSDSDSNSAAAASPTAAQIAPLLELLKQSRARAAAPAPF